jgi:hypothetical protein
MIGENVEGRDCTNWCYTPAFNLLYIPAFLLLYPGIFSDRVTENVDNSRGIFGVRVTRLRPGPPESE